MTDAPRPPGPSGMALLSEVLLTIHRSDQLAAVLAAASAGAARFGVASPAGCLVHDPATDGWFLTTLLDSGGRPIHFERLGVAPGPFLFRAPATPVSGTLAAVFGDAWGLESCAQVERLTESNRAIVAPMVSGSAVLGALFALTSGTAHAPLLAAILGHAATAAARCLPGAAGVPPDGVLDAVSFADVAERELLRAERYRREVSVAVFGVASTREVAHFGPVLVRTLRRWDIVGRVNGDRPLLAALLPETGRTGGRGLVRRLNRLLGGMPVGTACAPEDGWNLDRLLQAACGAMTLAAAYRAPGGLSGWETWSRGLAASAASETVRCPICLATYVRRRPADLPESLMDEQRERARAALRAACPRHEEYLTVSS